MKTKEDIVDFRSVDRLSGVMCSPVDGVAPLLDLVLVNSGIVHRIGANRVSTEIARQAALFGIRSLRFDISGIGESAARSGEVAWEQASVEDIGAAIALMKADPWGRPVALFGNCGGAAKSFWTALARPEVDLLILTNPPPLNGYRQDDCNKPPGLDRLIVDFTRLFERGVAVRIVFAQGDVGERFFDDFLHGRLLGFEADGQLQVTRIANSNHTFAPARARSQMIEKVVSWTCDYILGARGLLW